MADVKLEAKNEFLSKAGLKHYDEKIKEYIGQRSYKSCFSVDANGVLTMDVFTAGVRLLTADDKIISASNEIYITAKED